MGKPRNVRYASVSVAKSRRQSTNAKVASLVAQDISAATDDSAATETSNTIGFLDLPAELRVRIYEAALLVNEPLDLRPENYFRLHPRLALFLVCRRIHEEAYRIFYAQTVRLFPDHDRFFNTKQPLLARLSPRYRNAVRSLEWIVGKGWTAPPKCQCIHPALGLTDCTSVRKLKIFVRCDPSDSFFSGFRGKNATEDTYRWFCIDLLRELLDELPHLRTVEIDANPEVKKDAPLIMGLVHTIREAELEPSWGPLQGWDKELDELELKGLVSAMSGITMAVAPRAIPLEA